VPKIHKDTIMKEVERLCNLGVVERQPASEWALPLFIIPKKDKRENSQNVVTWRLRLFIWHH
jgi:hypothetical protein